MSSHNIMDPYPLLLRKTASQELAAHGIHVTSIVQPKTGTVIFLRCQFCGVTDIYLCDYAPPPSDGGQAWLVSMECGRHMVFPKVEWKAKPLDFPW